MSTTIASLALIKARYETDRHDVLDALRPFVSYVLTYNRVTETTANNVKSLISTEFGINIPHHTVDLLLKRLTKDGQLSRVKTVYTVISVANNLEAFKDNRARLLDQQNELIQAIIKFTSDKYNIEMSEDEAEQSIYNYLDLYGIECIKAYEHGTIVPIKGKSIKNWQYIVSSYVNEISCTDEYKFNYFVNVLTGRMLSNALLASDISDISMKFDNTYAYLDTPILLQILGILGDMYMAISSELIDLLKKSNAKIAIFEHTIDELDTILKNAERQLELESGGHGNVVISLRETGKSASDVVMLRGNMRNIFTDRGIEIKQTPKYVPSFQIDEAELNIEMAEAQLHYRYETAKRHDINSIRSIYVLRGGNNATRIEDCKALFITNNSALARAAFSYGKKHEGSRNVSTTITDFSLTNKLWLKSSIDHAELPSKIMTANCYAALRPSEKLWNRFLHELDGLQESGKITPEQHQYMRYELKVRDELMNFTLGDESALSETQIYQLLDMHTEQIVKPYKESIDKLEADLIEAKDSLNHKLDILSYATSQSAKIGRFVGITVKVSLTILAILFYGFAEGYISPSIINELNPILKNTFKFGSYVIAILSFLNILIGTTVWNPVSRMSTNITEVITRKIQKALGLNGYS